MRWLLILPWKGLSQLNKDVRCIFDNFSFILIQSPQDVRAFLDTCNVTVYTFFDDADEAREFAKDKVCTYLRQLQFIRSLVFLPLNELLFCLRVMFTSYGVFNRTG